MTIEVDNDDPSAMRGARATCADVECNGRFEMTKQIVGTNSSFNHTMVEATEVRMKIIAVDKRSGELCASRHDELLSPRTILRPRVMPHARQRSLARIVSRVPRSLASCDAGRPIPPEPEWGDEIVEGYPDRPRRLTLCGRHANKVKPSVRVSSVNAECSGGPSLT